MHDLELTDILSRFLTQRSHINWDKCAVRTSVFSEKHPKGFSVFHTTGLTDKQIQEIAHQYVINDPTRPLRGHFELEVAVYEQAKLSIKKSEPPPKHYNVFGMPVSSDVEEASKLSMRQFLVDKARLKLT